MHVRWVSVRWSILYTDRIHLHLWILPLCYRHIEKQVDRNKSPSYIDGGSFFFTFLMTIKTGMFSDDTSVIGFSIPASFTDLLIRWISAVPTWHRGKNTLSNPENIVPQMFTRDQTYNAFLCYRDLHTNILLLLLHGTNNGNNAIFFFIWLCSCLPCKLTTVQLLY